MSSGSLVITTPTTTTTVYDNLCVHEYNARRFSVDTFANEDREKKRAAKSLIVCAHKICLKMTFFYDLDYEPSDMAYFWARIHIHIHSSTFAKLELCGFEFA